MEQGIVGLTRRGLGLLACGALVLAAASGCGGKAGAQAASPTPTPGEAPIGERPGIAEHVSQADIVSGAISIDQCVALGQQLFVTKFNKLDGLGRPGATGNGSPTERTPGSAPDFVRTSSPDSVSCAACHNDPRPGGAGDFVANVFVGANNLDPVTFDVRNADERNTLGMMGAGPVELLGREMTADLQTIKANAIQQAMSSHAAVTVPLNTKGVNFGSLTANADGSVDTSGVQGVDPDLIIKPFSQKGVVRSIREFTINAMNQHHGMEAVERFGKGQLDSHGNVIQTDDFDQDGVPDELTVGDLTAITLFQALLNTPAQVFPPEPDRQAAALRGEQIFNAVGCTSCHVPSLVLNNPEFCEPYSLNPPGTFSNQTQKVCANLTQDGPGPRLKPDSDGVIRVFAYTDLKRHVICDSANPHYCNEPNPQNGVPTNEFLTRKLWDVASSAPYGHRGDLGTITEAILAHGGEATTARDAFAALPADQQADIVEFLKTLQVVPDGTPALVVDSLFRPLDKAALAKQLGIM